MDYPAMHNHPQFRNIGARWFPRELNLEHKMKNTGLALEHLCQYQAEGEYMFNRIAIVHEFMGLSLPTHINMHICDM